MHARRRHTVQAVLLTTALAVAFTALPASGQESGLPPGDVIRVRNEAVKATLDAAGDPVSDQTKEDLKGVINGLVDFRELSRRALRRHWNSRTPEEQDDFVKVFRELVRNSSVQKLGIYRVDSITYLPAETDGDESRVVTVVHKNGKQVEIVYEMHRVDGEWRAYDIVIDGSSTLRTYRDTFQREIRSSSYGAMYARLVEKLEKERSG